MISLIPMSPLFSLSIFNTQKPSEKLKRGRPGSIHHVSGCGVDVEGEGAIFKYVHTKQPVIKMSGFNHAKVWSPKL